MTTFALPQTRTFASQIVRSVFHQTLTHVAWLLLTVWSSALTGAGPLTLVAAAAGVAVATDVIASAATAVARTAPIRRLVFIAISPGILDRLPIAARFVEAMTLRPIMLAFQS